MLGFKWISRKTGEKVTHVKDSAQATWTMWRDGIKQMRQPLTTVDRQNRIGKVVLMFTTVFCYMGMAWIFAVWAFTIGFLFLAVLAIVIYVANQSGVFDQLGGHVAQWIFRREGPIIPREAMEVEAEKRMLRIMTISKAWETQSPDGRRGNALEAVAAVYQASVGQARTEHVPPSSSSSMAPAPGEEHP